MGLSPITEFALLARMPDEALDLEALAASVARMGNPRLDPGAVSATLDALAEQVLDHVSPSAPPDRLAAQMADALGNRLGFHGTRENFAHAASSYIDQVLEHRTGLPILVSVVWILLGKRLGVPVAGIGWPVHFIACLMIPGARIYVDPYSRGAALDVDHLLQHARDRSVLEPASTRAIVTRMVGNLRNLLVEQGDYEAALGAIDRLLLIGGEVPLHVRDRGLVARRLGRDAEARRDLLRYLSLAPEAPDRADIRRMLDTDT